MVTKIDFFPSLRGQTRFRKFRHNSEQSKRHWISIPVSFSFAVFAPKTKTNFEGETLYRALISVPLSDLQTSGAKAKSSFEGRIKMNTPVVDVNL